MGQNVDLPSALPGPLPQQPPPALSFSDLFLRLDGRIGRQAYWLSIVALNVVSNIVIGGLLRSGGTVATLIAIVLFIAFWWPTVCIVGKRFHDRDKSAWWCLIVLIPIVGWIWVVVECGFLAGDAEGNRFGRATAKTPFG